MKALILDMDGVLKLVDIENAERNAQRIDFSFRELSDLLWNNEYLSDFLTGKINRQEWWMKVTTLDERLDDVDQDIIWNGVFGKNYFNNEILEFVKSIPDSITKVILTNCDSISKERILTEFGSEYPFDYVISSSDLGYCKPEKNAFYKTLQIICTESRDCIFFDDSPKNVQSAKEIGINAYQYEGFASFKSLVEAFLNMNLGQSISE